MSTNPRGDAPPSYDPRLHENLSPHASLAESMSSIVDEARQLVTDLGLRPYRVFSVTVRWSGGERHRGQPRVVFQQELLPTPKVENFGNMKEQLREAGAVERGDVRLSQISGRYTEEEITSLFPYRATDADESFIEIAMDSRDGEEPVRRRFIVSSVPVRRPDRFDWEVTLTRQDGDRTRRGAVR